MREIYQWLAQSESADLGSLTNNWDCGAKKDSRDVVAAHAAAWNFNLIALSSV